MHSFAGTVVLLVVAAVRVVVVLSVIGTAGWLVRSLIRPTTDSSRFEEAVTVLGLGVAALPCLGLAVFVLGLPFTRTTAAASVVGLGAAAELTRTIRRRRGAVFAPRHPVEIGRRVVSATRHLSIPAMLVLCSIPLAALAVGVARAGFGNPPDAPFMAFGFDGSASFSNRAILLTRNSTVHYPLFVSQTGTEPRTIRLVLSIGEQTIGTRSVTVAPRAPWRGVVSARVPADLVCGGSGFSVDIAITDAKGSELGPRLALPVVGCRS